MPLRKFIGFNTIFSHKKDGKVYFEMLNPDACFFIKTDYANLLKNSFRWNDIETSAIIARYLFLQLINPEISAEKLCILNTTMFEEIFPLKYIDLITNCVNYDFGKPIYDKSLAFYTKLLEGFINFYLRKDLQSLERIDCEEIQTYTPLSRYNIQMANQRNQKILKKYFNEDFNLIKFALKIVDKFVPGATWRWVGMKHKCHLYSVEICKILTEYGLMKEEDLEDLKMILYSKIIIFSSLEKAFDRDSRQTELVKIHTGVLIKIREYYAEILIYYLYFKQDQEVLLMLKKIYLEGVKKKKALSREEMENIIRFNKTVLFEEEFGRKIMDFLMGYILSQNKINGVLLESPKLNSIVSKFLIIIANVSDPYLLSLQLIEEADYNKFAETNFIQNGFSNEMLITSNKIELLTKDLENVIKKTEKQKYIYNEEKFVDEMIEILDNVQKTFDFTNLYGAHSKNGHIIQKLFALGLVKNLFTLMSLYLSYQKSITKCSSFEDLMRKYSLLMRFYFHDNTENHCSFFIQENIYLIEDSLYNAPVEISSLFLEIFSRNSKIIISKFLPLDVLCGILTKISNNYFDKPESKEFEAIEKTISMIGLYLNFSNFKIFEWIPEYDIKISLYLIKPDFENYWKFENYEECLQKPFEKNNREKMKLLMSFLKLFQVATNCRYLNSVFKKFQEAFPKEKLIDLIRKCNMNYKYRSIFLQLYCIFNVDFKNYLVDERNTYYMTKPNDPEYDEDPFYDEEFGKTIDLFKSEIVFLLDSNVKNSEELSEFMNEALFPGIIKLMNYFLVIKDEDLVKMLKYVNDLDDFNLKLLAEKSKILSIYGNENEKNITIGSRLPFLSEKDKLLSCIDDIDEKFKLKKNKLKINALSQSIYDICSDILQQRRLNQGLRKLLSKKNTLMRVDFAINQLDILSSKMQQRKANLYLPFQQLIKQTQMKVNKSVILYLSAFYKHYKMTKMSSDSEKNIYIASLNDNSQEMETLTFNLCSFVYNKLHGAWQIDKKSEIFSMIECMCNTLFIATESIQKNFLKLLKNREIYDVMFNNVWKELKTYLSFVKFKTTIDVFWKEAYRKVLILVKFHHFLCEDNCSEFKEKICMGPIIEGEATNFKRIDRWMTIYKNLCDTCEWHLNFSPNEISEFNTINRAHLFPLGRAILDCLAEYCTGPEENVQLAVNKYSYERYTGILNRYTSEPECEFYKMKLSLIDYLLAMSEEMNPEIVSYHSTNLEVQSINRILINSIRQLFYCFVKKITFNKTKLADYPLKYEDFHLMMKEFEDNPEFSNYTLFKISLKLFIYMKGFAEVKSKYELFIRERDEAIKTFEETKQIHSTTINEEDIFVYKFLNSIIVAIEITREKTNNVVNHYFPIESKSFYLSEESKTDFLLNVDRSSSDSKLSGLLFNAKFFKYEMEFSQKRFKTIKNHQLFGSGKQVYFLEWTTFILTFLNNLILLIFYDDRLGIHSGYFATQSQIILIFGIIEIVLSLISVVSFLYLNYPMVRTINMRKYKADYAYKKDLNITDKFFVNVYQSFLNQKVVVFFFHMILVILGLIISYGFIGLDFLSIVTLFPQMRNIIKSITENYSQLRATLILAAVIMYAYSTFIHIYFLSDFNSDYPGSIFCSSLAHCYLTIVDKAFRNGEGIGGLLLTAYYGNETGEGGDFKFYAALFVNLSFFLIINVIILNIILAVLVDTFSQLRKKSDFFSIFSFLIIIAKSNFFS